MSDQSRGTDAVPAGAPLGVRADVPPAHLRVQLALLRDGAAAIAAACDVPDDPANGGSASHARWVHERLTQSVLRPLATVPAGDPDAAAPPAPPVDAPPTDGAPGVPADLADQVWHLACTATTLRVQSPGSTPLAEAAAALQDLALAMAEPAVAAERYEELCRLQAAVEPQIQVMHDGPYLVTNATGVVDWLGRRMPGRPTLALCRCGRSDRKPLCDGAHARTGFTDAKDPRRVPDQVDTYVGLQVTVLDNRGSCQHSGLCTDRLPTAFRTGAEPFVAPSGGRMDEIIRAVRDCPSGALSYAIDGHEERAAVDHHGARPPSVEVSKDGPYRVTGGFPLRDDDGAPVPRNQGSSSEHYALCRCGQSQNKPFCSGMHWYVQFHDPVPEEGHEPSIFEWAGGLPALTRLTRLFYEKHIPQDPLLAPLFGSMAADHPQRVAAWLGEVFGGPAVYSGGYGGYPRMLSQHLGKGLTEEQRTRWVELLTLSAREAGLPNDPEFRSAFGSYIEWGSRLAVENSQTTSRPPEHMPMPHWNWNTAAGPPGSRISALRPADEPDEVVVEVPPLGEPVSYERHIRGLFRAVDRRSMSFAFDLWSHRDVTDHAATILSRLQDGSMPCDAPWPQERLDVLRRWIEEGHPA